MKFLKNKSISLLLNQIHVLSNWRPYIYISPFILLDKIKSKIPYIDAILPLYEGDRQRRYFRINKPIGNKSHRRPALVLARESLENSLRRPGGDDGASRALNNPSSSSLHVHPHIRVHTRYELFLYV